ncbi:HAD-IA family hydrolase OS=Streptomyces tendae OX=1932 GN=GUR47_28955 PE=4 SV=1 [Streptomyces tendae]
MSGAALRRAGPRTHRAPPPARPPWDPAEVREVRDDSSALHRAACTGLSQSVPLPHPGLHDALYERHMSPSAWSPYADAAEVLSTLRGRGIAVGVVSDIGWDLRPVFRAHGLDRYVDTYVLSYEHGIRKPDPRLFRIACARWAWSPAGLRPVLDLVP